VPVIGTSAASSAGMPWLSVSVAQGEHHHADADVEQFAYSSVTP
jgi:hypothetical protein